MIPLGVLASAYVTPAGGGGDPLNPTYITQAVDSVGRSTYTWSDVSIGAESSTRTVLVVFNARISTTITTATTITATIGGNAATVDYYKHVTPAESGGQATGAVGFIRLPIASGTTATIAVTVSANCLRAGIMVYTFDGPATLADSGWGYEASALGLSIPLSTEQDGALITSGTYAAPTGASLVAPSAEYAGLVGSNYYHQAGSVTTTSAGSTATWSTTSASYTVAAAIAYAPA